MNSDEALDVTHIYSVAGMLTADMPLVRHRPFRSPHHTISHAGLVGGGTWPRPGEISLAHRGVLFLDEMPEFGQHTLEVLRQPLDPSGKVVTVSRAQGSLTFPAAFMMMGAMNPCPCGYFGDPEKECTCSATYISRYQKRLSGPLLDRIDITYGVLSRHIEMPRAPFHTAPQVGRGGSSPTNGAASRRRRAGRGWRARGRGRWRGSVGVTIGAAVGATVGATGRSPLRSPLP